VTSSVEARFEIFGFAGLHVATTRTSVAETPDDYTIAMDVETRGIASFFVNLTSHSETRGSVAGDVFRSKAYRAEVKRNGTDHHYSLDYGSDGTIIKALAPAESSVLLAAERARGSVDQLTAYFILEHRLVRSGTCAFVVPVLDDGGFYNLRFSDLGPETLTPDRAQNLASPTQVCAVARDDITTRHSQDEDTYRRGKIWYARLAGAGRMIPVRMEYETGFGVVRGYLAELRGPSVDLQLMRE
jgi:hypothetical protein